ncbi:MAG TPA: hypothetical protein VFW76_11140 [Ktedonobacterales bacterium]|nr:hypothetical protein [Ktedonobacterales bacterium]
MHLDVSRLVPEAQPIAARVAAVRDYYPDEATVDGRLAVIARGVEFLATAQAWWVEYQR